MQHFSHPEKPGYEIRTRLRSNTFSILLKNHIVGGPFWGYQIEQKLTEHVK
ncbi:hypothetical protein JMG10_07635 [Nostoc ellipsosporum NOK]|nr:hypothetical protein [Nostoc ellipsosporum NOK]